MVDGIGFGGVRPSEVYNKVKGNEAEFINLWQQTYQGDANSARQMYNYVHTLEKDGTPGLSQEEYVQGLTDKRSHAEIRRDNIYSKHNFTPEEIENFNKMSDFDKLRFLKDKIPHKPEQDTEAHIMASLSLDSLNRLNTEITLINGALEDNAVDVAIGDYLKSYINEENIPKFKEMSQKQKVEFLKTHVAHTQGTTEKELEAFALSMLNEMQHIEATTRDFEKAKAEMPTLKPLEKPEREQVPPKTV